MGISVSTSSGGASRPRALASRRLMDVDERLPTKYPTLYVAMVASLTGSDGSCRCPCLQGGTPRWGDSLYALGHSPTRRDHEAIGQLTMKKNWSADRSASEKARPSAQGPFSAVAPYKKQTLNRDRHEAFCYWITSSARSSS